MRSPRTPLCLICILVLLATFDTPAFGQNQSKSAAGDTTKSGKSQEAYDYDALVKELYATEEEKKEPSETVKPTTEERKRGPKNHGPAPGMFPNGRLNGASLSFTGSSPYAVSGNLESWYSYIDASVAVKLPYEVWVESIPLYFIFEVSTFSFENTFPQGGTFSGLSYVLQASAIGDQSSAAVGFGFWDSEMGSMLELGYRFRPTTNTYFRVGTRGVLITDIDTIGPAWWAEVKFSMGFEL